MPPGERIDSVEIRIRLQRFHPKLNRDSTKAKKIKKRLTQVDYTRNVVASHFEQ